MNIVRESEYHAVGERRTFLLGTRVMIGKMGVKDYWTLAVNTRS